ncbi:membrane protein insertase YidC [Marinimicrobium sp. C6131]|uniref:membrane protein insertase YidC n=1 Tax=Marinimicrobium sp. C6131 TaxID=3022676 RepID=UPI00223CED80|nr:membrane protein insertase YidC [Marinimicrobium sp. C6131]UZJ43753.1 membrane protein insertase YidC [Marinimicrobium sp. C6131]
MDWQKTLLITAMCAVVFTLVIRYNDFQESLAEQSSQPRSEQTSSPENDNDIPDATDTASELPSAPGDTANDVEVPSQNNAARQPIRVETDTLIVEIDPRGGDLVYSALRQHYARLNKPDEPYVLLNNTDAQTYVAQSGLVGRNATDTRDGERPVFQSSQQQYQLADGADQLQVDLTYQQGDVTITKRYTFERGEYLVRLDYLVDNQSDEPWQANLYGQIKRDSSAAGAGPGGLFALNPFLGAAITTDEEKYKKLDFDDLSEQTFKTQKEGGWVAMVQHYFVSAWIPDAEKTHNYHLRQLGNRDMYLLGFTSPSTEVAPGTQGQISAQFYTGPKDTQKLETISPYLDLTVDYGWLWWIAKPLFTVLDWLHGFLNNWGLAIIALTIIIKAAFFKLSATSYRSMAKMRKLSPKMAELKERYGDDRQKMSQELMKLYKKEKVNPLGGCLPILIQMPVFLALYWVLMESVELRHAPFFLWIQDLSVKDPYYVLPLLMGLTMFIQFKLNPTPPDPTQAKIMQLMPIVFTFLFLFFPAGLVLYWVTNNTLSITQQYIITRQIEREGVKS